MQSSQQLFLGKSNSKIKEEELSSKQTKFDSVSKVLLRGSAKSLLVQLGGLFLLFTANVLLARYLTTQEYGIYSFAISWVNVLLVIGVMGWDVSAVKFVPTYIQNKEFSLINGFFHRSLQLALVRSLFVASLIFLVIKPYFGGIARDSSTLFWVVIAFFITSSSLEFILSGFLRGHKKIFRSLAPSKLGRPILLIITILVCYKQETIKIDAQSILFIQSLASVVIVAVLLFLISKNNQYQKGNNLLKYKTKKWTKVAAPMFMIATFNLLLSRVDILMIGSLEDASMTAIYSVASRISQIINLGLIAVSAIASPVISEIYSSGDTQKLQKTLHKIARIVIIISLPLFLVIIGWTDLFLGFFGNEYLVGAQVLKILSSVKIFSVIIGPVGILLVMTGHQKQAAIILAAATTIHVFLNLALIPQHGILGAAMSSMISVAFWNTAMAAYSIYKLKLRTMAF